MQFIEQILMHKRQISRAQFHPKSLFNKALSHEGETPLSTATHVAGSATSQPAKFVLLVMAGNFNSQEMWLIDGFW